MDNRKLTETLSRTLDVSIETVGLLIDGLSKAIGEKGAELQSVSIPSFGTFEPKKKNERIALHPASGKRLLLPPKVSLVFRPSPTLKQRIKDGK